MRDLPIAYGNSCHAKFWSNKTTSFDGLYERMTTPIRTTETCEEYAKMSRADKETAKDRGGFVAGKLRENRRLRANVACRSMITLDGDKLEEGFIAALPDRLPFDAVLYTTHGHTPGAPRARILIPLTRDVSVDEFVAISRYLAADLGIDQFDECSYRPQQLMYWPTVPANGEFICRRLGGEWLDPDGFLSRHPDWKDCSLLPTSSRESAVRNYDGKKQEDPLAKEGIVGAFCRAYGIRAAIDKYLSGVYEPTDRDDRYHFIESDSMPGVQVFDDKFLYSFHATDPACGKLLNAFDLVRIHRFGDDDPKRSFSEMHALAMEDGAVKRLMLEEHRAEAASDFTADDDDSWKEKLIYQKRGDRLENCLHNIQLIMQNDPFMKHIVFNQLADGMEIKGEVPWKHPAKFWRDADDAQLICYVDANYGTFSKQNYSIAVTKAVDDRSYHPIRDYFAALPEWDQTPRVDKLLTDYLGADDNAYVRAVIRKTLCAAYRRVYSPGIKFDYIPVLNGAQGIGKSTFIARLGMEWFSDSLNLSDMNDKTAAEKLQGYWIMEIGELAGMKKADLDKVKAFISRQDDKYRASFGRYVTPHPRQCIFFGTTNNEDGYLRDITGNRRYWNVRVTGRGKYKPWDLTEDIVCQIWAEVKVLAGIGEKLFLPPDLEAIAENEQRGAMEQDDREGFVRNYLDMLLPACWDDMDLDERRRYILYPGDPTRAKGVQKRTTVSNIEIWCECFGKPQSDMQPKDSYAIAAIMMRLAGWERAAERRHLPIYGRQRVYTVK